MLTFPFTEELIFYLIAYVIPGIMLGFGLFKNKNTLDRAVLGIPIVIFLETFLTFIINLFGTPFSVNLVYVSITLAYFISFISLLIRRNDFAIHNTFKGITENPLATVISLFAILLAIFSFYIRIQSISPVYYELDPYFYLYSAFQLITLGHVPMEDATAWYPYHSSHRVVPLLTHFFAFPYVVIEKSMDIYKLSYSANFYPPFAFAIMLLLFYVLFRNLYNDKAAILSIMLLFYNEMFLSKTMSGVFEAQPMGFMLLTYSLTLMVLALKTKEKLMFYLTGIAISFTYLASNFGFIAFGLFALSSFIYTLYLFYKQDLKSLELFKSRIFFVVLISFIIFSVNRVAYMGSELNASFLKTIALFFSPFIFAYILFHILLRFKEKFSTYKYHVTFALMVVFFLLFFSPLGDFMKSPIKSAFSIAQYNTVLERTIAEQQQISSSIYQYTGFLGKKDESFYNQIFAGLFNSFSEIFYAILNIAGMNIKFIPKEPSFALTIITLSIIILFVKFIYSLIKDNPSWMPLFVLVVLFVMGGSLKTKYGILLSYAFLISTSIVIGEFVLLPITVMNFSKNREEKNKNKEKKESKPLLDESSASMLSSILFVILFISISSAFFDSSAYSLLAVSKYEKFSENPEKFASLLQQFCSSGREEYCSDLDTFLQKIENQFDTDLCLQSVASQVFSDYGEIPEKLNYGIRMKCMYLPRKWITAMNFISTTEKDSRVISWWDYGHWINYFGKRNAVIRNEHSYLNMILEVADAFVMKDESNLRKVMKKYGSNYVLIDDEIILSPGTVFGSKFYALNYLACAGNNLTDVSISQMNSMCEYENLWETVFVSKEECVISKITGEKGKLVYRLVPKKTYEGIQQVPEKAYCLGSATLSDGSTISALYYLNKTNEVGDLLLNKGILAKTSNENVFVVLYTKDKIWNVNGKIVDGWEDRKGRFYDSVIYKGFVIGELDGFKKVFDNGGVKIYKLIE